MRSQPVILLAVLLCAVLALPVAAQQSDFAVKKSFEERYNTIKGEIDSAATLAQLDSLKVRVDGLEMDYLSYSAFLEKALYPDGFQGKMKSLRTHHILTYDRVYLIQTQGVRISDLEARIAVLTGRLDTLTAERNQLFAELQESKRSLAALREAMKRLTANLQAKDRLIFALVDSIFLPYSKDMNQIADVQKQAIGRKLDKANVLTRVYEVASDNLKFLDVTQLQGKDFANLIDHYQQFKGRWAGLSDKIVAVAASETKVTVPQAKPGAPGVKDTTRAVGVKPPGAAVIAPVDSLLAEWNTQLNRVLWSTLAGEFAARGVTVNPFSDAKSFSASIRAYVDSAKAKNMDASVFVKDIWKDRIDKEWREALVKESMLGKTEYAALDKLVSELSQEKIDWQFILYTALVIGVALVAWWFLARKPKPPQAEQKA